MRTLGWENMKGEIYLDRKKAVAFFTFSMANFVSLKSNGQAWFKLFFLIEQLYKTLGNEEL
ncbi:hypothetical protein T08_314 [Trichinella sp. T8]|uniref:Uncharacterized protein n=1 Tax=Trichinella murrelli TaxID=144512 RepID=A0A0V0U1D0_9BILA|nr:hypothetical protein T05_9106 [Trichinella murrelli]KRZ88395.1 hypothetical protein T08_314 [Trichinella sp. T8]